MATIYSCYNTTTVQTSYNAAMAPFELDNTEIIYGHWVFNIEIDGNIRYKTRWVASGILQTYGLGSMGTYALTSRMTSIWVMFIMARMELISCQLNIIPVYSNIKLT